MKIGFIAPSVEEMQPFLDLMQKVNKWQKFGYTFVSGDYRGNEVVGVLCGIGKVNASTATTLLVDNHSPDCVFVGGVCGAIDDQLNIGDAIICTNVCHHDVLERFLTKNPPFFKSATFFADESFMQKIKDKLTDDYDGFKLYYGKLATGEQFIEDDGRDEIKANINPLGVDMETASVAQVCVSAGVPFLALRTVTDTPKERGINAFEKNLAKATFNQGVVLSDIFKAIV